MRNIKMIWLGRLLFGFCCYLLKTAICGASKTLVVLSVVLMGMTHSSLDIWHQRLRDTDKT